MSRSGGYAASTTSRRSRRSTRSAGAGGAKYEALQAKMQASASRQQALALDNEQLQRDNARLRSMQRDRVNLNVLDAPEGATDAKVVALQSLHSQKIRALMRSIDRYKREGKALSAQSRESARSRQIQGLQAQLRGAELVGDLLKERLCETLECAPLEVNQWVFNKSIGGPKRFRPKTREALLIELERLKKQHDRAVVKAQTSRQALKEEQDKVRTMAASRQASRSSLAPSEGKAPSPSSASTYGSSSSSSRRAEGKTGGGGGGDVDYSHRVVELLGQVDALRQQSEIKDRQIRTYVSKVETLHEAKRELIGYKDKYERSRGKHAQLGEEVERMHQEAINLRRQLERTKELNLRLEAEVDVQKEEAQAGNQDVGRQRLRDLQKISELTEELSDVRSELDKAKRDAAVAHQQRLSGTQKAEVTTGQLGKQLKDLEAERAELRAELKRMQVKVEDVTRDAGAALKQSNSETERKMQAQARTIKKLTSEREDAEKEAVRADQRVQNVEKQMDQQKREFTSRVERLEKQLQAKDGEVRGMVAKHAELEFKSSKAESQVQSLSKEGSAGLAEAMEMYKKERDARKKLQAKCHELKQQVSAFKMKFRQLEADYDALRVARSDGGVKAGGGPAAKTPARADVDLYSDREEDGSGVSEDSDEDDDADEMMMR